MSDYLKIQFLGTGASVPSKYRGFSSLVLNRDEQLILFDCGEATQMRLQQAGIKPFRISAIMISHLHGDHLFGLPGLMASMQMAERQSLLRIYGPVGIRAFLSGLEKTVYFKMNYPVKIIEIPATGDSFLIDDWQVTALPLTHKIPCMGFRFQEPEKAGAFDAEKADKLGVPQGPERAALKRGETIHVGDQKIVPEQLVGQPIPGRIFAYCTDTRPCENSRTLAQNADLLVHDSTFTNEFQEQAELTTHSTAQEAAFVARTAGAHKLALYHISIRLHGAQEKILIQEALEIFENTLLPQDFEDIVIRRRA